MAALEIFLNEEGEVEIHTWETGRHTAEIFPPEDIEEACGKAMEMIDEELGRRL